MTRRVIAVIVILVVFIAGGMALTVKRSAEQRAKLRDEAISAPAKPPPRSP